MYSEFDPHESRFVDKPPNYMITQIPRKSSFTFEKRFFFNLRIFKS
jgi:hypothetical protein